MSVGRRAIRSTRTPIRQMRDYVRVISGGSRRYNFSVGLLLSLRMISFKQCIDAFTFVFFLTSPLTSYGDQILAMHRRKSSAGFSIDVCGIMLVARYTPEDGRVYFMRQNC